MGWGSSVYVEKIDGNIVTLGNQYTKRKLTLSRSYVIGLAMPDLWVSLFGLIGGVGINQENYCLVGDIPEKEGVFSLCGKVSDLNPIVIMRKEHYKYGNMESYILNVVYKGKFYNFKGTVTKTCVDGSVKYLFGSVYSEDFPTHILHNLENIILYIVEINDSI